MIGSQGVIKRTSEVNLDQPPSLRPPLVHPVRNRYILVADVVLIAMSAWGAYALRFDWLFSLYRAEFPIFLGCMLLVKPIAFYAFGCTAVIGVTPAFGT